MSSGSPTKKSISGVEKKKQDNDSDNESNCSLGSNASTVTASVVEPIGRVSSGTARTLEQKEKLREEKQKEKVNIVKKNQLKINLSLTCEICQTGNAGKAMVELERKQKVKLQQEKNKLREEKNKANDIKS